jgi:hypothetical protein
MPRAKYALMTSHVFYCFSGTGEPEIYYIELPSFGRRFYQVKTSHWGYLD